MYLRLLRFVAGNKNVVGAERVVRGHDDPDRAIDGRKLLHRQRIVHVTQTGATKLYREDDAHQAHLAQLLHHLERELAGFVPAHDIGSDFARREITNLLAQLLLLVGQGKGMAHTQCGNLGVHP